MIHGRITLKDGKFLIFLEPHASMQAKRIFTRLRKTRQGHLHCLEVSPETAADIEWFCIRYPLEIDHVAKAEIERLAASYRERIARLEDLIDANYVPRSYDLALPPREYQRHGADWFLRTERGILGDDVGLGKTVTAITAFSSGGDTLPAIVVTLPHLQRQWQKELARFSPQLRSHILKKGTPYELPKIQGAGPDVVILNYHKLDGWGEVLGKYGRCVIFDEVQELRRRNSGGIGLTKKYAGATALSRQVKYCLGMSATPIYNYGGEMYNVIEAVAPDRLGEWIEFAAEWCSDYDMTKAPLRNPDAFGSWLRVNFLMLRRTRKDVGRELGRLTKITHTVLSDSSVIDSIKGRAGELARIILGGTESERGAKMNATEQLSTVLRQATGIAKAPYVAEFVRLLVESGESVVLFGYHHAVYRIWAEQLRDLNPVFYTGSESPTQKEESRESFIQGKSKVLVVSLRSGVGLDGLQYKSRTCVFGELDWSPAVHEQCVGRIDRDGQQDPVTAYFLTSEDGIDPYMCEVLGLKTEQVDGLREASDDRILEQRADNADAIRKIAQRYLGVNA